MQSVVATLPRPALTRAGGRRGTLAASESPPLVKKLASYFNSGADAETYAQLRDQTMRYEMDAALLNLRSLENRNRTA